MEMMKAALKDDSADAAQLVSPLFYDAIADEILLDNFYAKVFACPLTVPPAASRSRR